MKQVSTFKIITMAIAPLLSLFIFMLGNGLFNTLLTVRLHHEAISSLIIGLVSASYYGGLVIGSFYIEDWIMRVGHIRAFAGFASILAAISMLQGLWVLPWLWIFLRLIGGFCTAGLFIVIESWLLIISSIETRGQILAIYMIALYAAQASGQFLLNLSDPSTLVPFCITTILCSLAVVPIVMAKIQAPQFEKPTALKFKKLYSISPSGVIGCFCAGLILGATYGLVPLFISQVRPSVHDVAYLTAIVIFGGMALQYPVGHLSDHLDRRKMLLSISALTVLTAVLIIVFGKVAGLLAVLLFAFGGLTFTIYPLSISHACDYLDPGHIIPATQGLLLAYSVGATIGPIIAPNFINLIGPNGLFIYFAAVAGSLALFFSWRQKTAVSLPVSEQQEFVATTNTTPVATEMDPRAEE